MAQSRFSWFDVIITTISTITLLLDFGTDVAVTWHLYSQGWTVWWALTLTFVLVPLVVTTGVSLKWHSADKSLTSPSILLPHVCLLAPFHRYGRVLWLGMRSTLLGHPRHTDAALREQNDAGILRLVEAFLESAPQLVVQLTFIMMHPSSLSWITLFSVSCSLLSLSWALTVYCDSSRLTYEVAYPRRALSLAVHWLWQVSVAAARVAALVLFTTIFHFWVCLFVGLHWVAMTAWIWLKGSDFGGQGWMEKVVLHVSSGYMYVFAFLNLQEGPSRARLVPYYILTFLENGCLFAVWMVYGKPHDYFKLAAALVVFGGFFLGLVCMLVYYRWLHPSGPHYAFSVRVKLPISIIRRSQQHPSKEASRQVNSTTAVLPKDSILELSVESEDSSSSSAEKGQRTGGKAGESVPFLLGNSSRREDLESAWQSGMQSSSDDDDSSSSVSSDSSLDLHHCNLTHFNATARSESLALHDRDQLEPAVGACSELADDSRAHREPACQTVTDLSLQPSEYTVTPPSPSPPPHHQHRRRVKQGLKGVEEEEDEKGEEDRAGTMTESSASKPTKSRSRVRRFKLSSLVDASATPSRPPSELHRAAGDSSGRDRTYHIKTSSPDNDDDKLDIGDTPDPSSSQPSKSCLNKTYSVQSNAAAPQNTSQSCSAVKGGVSGVVGHGSGVGGGSGVSMVDQLSHSFQLELTPIMSSAPESGLMSEETSFIRADREAMAEEDSSFVRDAVAQETSFVSVRAGDKEAVMVRGNASFVRADGRDGRVAMAGSEEVSLVREAMAPYPDLVECLSPDPRQAMCLDTGVGERAGGESMWGVSPNQSTDSSSANSKPPTSSQLTSFCSDLPPGSTQADDAQYPPTHDLPPNTKTSSASAAVMVVDRIATEKSAIKRSIPTMISTQESCAVQCCVVESSALNSLALDSPCSSGEHSPDSNNSALEDCSLSSPEGVNITVCRNDAETSWSSMNVNENEWSGLNNLKNLTPDDSLCSFAEDQQEDQEGEEVEGEGEEEGEEGGEKVEGGPRLAAEEGAFSRCSTPTSLPRSRSASSLYHDFSSAGVSPSPPPGLKTAAPRHHQHLSRHHSWVGGSPYPPSTPPTPFTSNPFSPDASFPSLSNHHSYCVDPAPPVHPTDPNPDPPPQDPREVVIQMLMDQLRRSSARGRESSLNQSMNQSMNSSHTRLLNQSMNQSMSQPMSHPHSRSHNPPFPSQQNMTQSLNHSLSQSMMNQSVLSQTMSQTLVQSPPFSPECWEREALRGLMQEDSRRGGSGSPYRGDIDLMRRALDLIEHERFPHRFHQRADPEGECPEMYVSGQYRPPIVGNVPADPQPLQHPAVLRVSGRQQAGHLSSQMNNSMSQGPVQRSSLRGSSPSSSSSSHHGSVQAQMSNTLSSSHSQRGGSPAHPHPSLSQQQTMSSRRGRDSLSPCVGDSEGVGQEEREGLYRYFVHSNSPIHTPLWNTPLTTPLPTPQATPLKTASQRHLPQSYVKSQNTHAAQDSLHLQQGQTKAHHLVQSAETRTLRTAASASRDHAATLPTSHEGYRSEGHRARGCSSLPQGSVGPSKMREQMCYVDAQTSSSRADAAQHQQGIGQRPARPLDNIAPSHFSHRLEVQTDHPDSGMHSGSHSGTHSGPHSGPHSGTQSAASRRHPLQSLDNSPSLSPSSSVSQHSGMSGHHHTKPQPLSQSQPSCGTDSNKQQPTSHSISNTAGGRSCFSSAQPPVSATGLPHPHSPKQRQQRPHSPRQAYSNDARHSQRQGADRNRGDRGHATGKKAKSVDCLR